MWQKNWDQNQSWQLKVCLLCPELEVLILTPYERKESGSSDTLLLNFDNLSHQPNYSRRFGASTTAFFAYEKNHL